MLATHRIASEQEMRSRRSIYDGEYECRNRKPAQVQIEDLPLALQYLPMIHSCHEDSCELKTMPADFFRILLLDFSRVNKSDSFCRDAECSQEIFFK